MRWCSSYACASVDLTLFCTSRSTRPTDRSCDPRRSSRCVRIKHLASVCDAPSRVSCPIRCSTLCRPEDGGFDVVFGATFLILDAVGLGTDGAGLRGAGKASDVTVGGSGGGATAAFSRSTLLASSSAWWLSLGPLPTRPARRSCCCGHCPKSTRGADSGSTRAS